MWAFFAPVREMSSIVCWGVNASVIFVFCEDLFILRREGRGGRRGRCHGSREFWRKVKEEEGEEGRDVCGRDGAGRLGCKGSYNDGKGAIHNSTQATSATIIERGTREDKLTRWLRLRMHGRNFLNNVTGERAHMWEGADLRSVHEWLACQICLDRSTWCDLTAFLLEVAFGAVLFPLGCSSTGRLDFSLSICPQYSFTSGRQQSIENDEVDGFTCRCCTDVSEVDKGSCSECRSFGGER